MKFETRAFLMIVVVAVFMALGTYFTMVVPLTDQSLYTPTKDAKPYTALEAQGKKIYEREGCVYCHTQQVRNLLQETQRYGMGEEETNKRFQIRALIQAPPSQPGEYVYDKPHLLGTRRTGPDLARVGGKYDNSWHLNHFRDPRSTSPGSLMPAYTWLYDKAGQPTQEAIALVAYVQKLGSNIKWREQGVEQARALAAKNAPPAPQTIPTTTPEVKP
jgi:cbb3-type cytochrome oxidase cytochrome c subunit